MNLIKELPEERNRGRRRDSGCSCSGIVRLSDNDEPCLQRFLASTLFAPLFDSSLKSFSTFNFVSYLRGSIDLVSKGPLLGFIIAII